jgi:hypothetical protein
MINVIASSHAGRKLTGLNDISYYLFCNPSRHFHESGTFAVVRRKRVKALIKLDL